MPFKVFFLIDENLPFELLEFFRKRSYRAEHIKKINKSGIKNGEVYQYAEQKKQWIITRDADFLSYFKFSKYNVCGVIVIKTSVTNKKYILKIISAFFDKYSDQLNEKRLIVIEDNNITINE